MRVLIAAFCATTLLTFPAVGQNMMTSGAPMVAPPVAGVIQSFDGKTVTLKATDGRVVTAALAPNARIMVSVPKTLADIKPGDFIASGGVRGADGKIHASEIRIFTAPGGEGQFPMSQPGQVMTNATVKQVMTDATVKQVQNGSGAPVIKLSFHGAGAPGSANCTGRATDAPGGTGSGCVGETEFDVPANTPVVAVMPAEASMLKPGTKASIGLTKAADGTSQATRITLTK
jgi:hypothetical protein